MPSESEDAWMAAEVTGRKFQGLRRENDPTEKRWPRSRPSASLSQAALSLLLLRPQPAVPGSAACALSHRPRRGARLRELRTRGRLQVRLGLHSQDTSAWASRPVVLTDVSVVQLLLLNGCHSHLRSIIITTSQ
uniref:Uncharacterized protein n=1 Tax=Molossus molossus TaxID=27622 RepID=A0A7J8HZY6_MOLMO|nr:hypothetical protein HJG59_010773 [Molossus molossus]